MWNEAGVVGTSTVCAYVWCIIVMQVAGAGEWVGGCVVCSTFEWSVSCMACCGGLSPVFFSFVLVRCLSTGLCVCGVCVVGNASERHCGLLLSCPFFVSVASSFLYYRVDPFYSTYRHTTQRRHTCTVLVLTAYRVE